MSGWELISTILTAVFGGSTLVSTLLFYGANKRAKEVSVRDAELDHNNKRLDSLHEDIDLLNGQLTNAYKDKERCEEIIADKTSKIRELNEQIVDLYKELNKKDNYTSALKRYIDWLGLWHCERELPHPDMTPQEVAQCCERRRPPHQTPVRYVPFDKSILKTDCEDESE